MNWRGAPVFAAAFAVVLAISAVTTGMTFTSGYVERVGTSGHPARTASGWSFVGAALQTTPRPVPGSVSAVVTAPTRLPGAGISLQLNPGVSGQRDIAWSFNESFTVSANQEWMLTFKVNYVVGGVAQSFSTTVYIETQAIVPLAPTTYLFLWDGGRRAVTPTSELELAQPCTSIGSCP
jgi:hypothetical protein